MELSRRQLMAAAAALVIVGGDSHNGGTWLPRAAGPLRGPARVADALTRSDVTLLSSPFLANMTRNTAYLLFLDPDRMLRSFRVNYGQPVRAEPIGGWENPASQVRGHTTGHLLSALAITYANTGDPDVLERGSYLVEQLAALQSRAVAAGFHPGYLSAFPESQFDRLEAGQAVWSPYYMIHKYIAGMLDQYQLTGNGQALAVAASLGDWVCWRTGRLPYQQMQMVLETEYGGLPEALADLYAATGLSRYLDAAQRFYHARVLDPLAAGVDQLAGVHANMTVPKITSSVRLAEELGSARYLAIAQNFWTMVTQHHSYVIGGVSFNEHFQAPDVVAARLSNFTCENCVSYNMLKLTRLLSFHQPARAALLDYYERVLFNQMLGEQDPASPHGFNCYYTGVSAGARKQQPLNYFPRGDPGVYATDYDTFTCDTATGIETQAKFAETIYSGLPDGISVNLFIPSRVRFGGIVLEQQTAFPDSPLITFTVLSGTAELAVRVRVPAWIAGPARVVLNGAPYLPGAVDLAASSPGWITLRRRWTAGDSLEVTLPMAVSFPATPDQPAVRAATYGPVVLSGIYQRDPGPALPGLDPGSVRRSPGDALSFTARANGSAVQLIPIARVAHQYYTTYWKAP